MAKFSARVSEEDKDMVARWFAGEVIWDPAHIEEYAERQCCKCFQCVFARVQAQKKEEAWRIKSVEFSPDSPDGSFIDLAPKPIKREYPEVIVISDSDYNSDTVPFECPLSPVLGPVSEVTDMPDLTIASLSETGPSASEVCRAFECEQFAQHKHCLCGKPMSVWQPYCSVDCDAFREENRVRIEIPETQENVSCSLFDDSIVSTEPACSISTSSLKSYLPIPKGSVVQSVNQERPDLVQVVPRSPSKRALLPYPVFPIAASEFKDNPVFKSLRFDKVYEKSNGVIESSRDSGAPFKTSSTGEGHNPTPRAWRRVVQKEERRIIFFTLGYTYEHLEGCRISQSSVINARTGEPHWHFRNRLTEIVSGRDNVYSQFMSQLSAASRGASKRKAATYGERLRKKSRWSK